MWEMQKLEWQSAHSYAQPPQRLSFVQSGASQAKICSSQIVQPSSHFSINVGSLKRFGWVWGVSWVGANILSVSTQSVSSSGTQDKR